MPRPANEDRKPEILAATCRVIAKKGIGGLYLRHVADEAGVSRALVSYYYETRAALMREALAFAEQRAIDQIASRSDTTGPAPDRITQALELEFDDAPAVRENWLLWESVTEAAMFDPELREPIELWSRAWNEAVAAMIRDGQQDGTVARGMDPAATAERLTGLVDGLGPRWLLGQISANRAQELVRQGVARELAGAHS